LPEPGCGTVVDVGANMGVISIGMLRDGQFARAVALEPDPRNFALLRHNLQQNALGAERCVCLRQGASNQAGELQFELSADNYGDHRIRAAATQGGAAGTDTDRFEESCRSVTTVPVDTLDQLLASTPPAFAEDAALVWIDTQGHEGYVFAGGRRTFARGMPVVAEFWPYGIRRSGMSQRQFCEIAASQWSHYWVWRRERHFVRYPIASLDSLFAELSDDGDFDNIVLTQ
jgi:FkbM family methyltransferase